MLFAVLAVFLLAFMFGCPTNPPVTPPVNVTPPVSNVTPPVTNVTPPENITPPVVNVTPPTPPEVNVTNVTPPVVNVTPPTPPTPPVPPATGDKITAAGLTYIDSPTAALNMYFIDVGTGDAILLKKGNFNMLIDAGNADNGEKVATFLRQVGVDDIQILVATDASPNNIGGMPAVIAAFPIEQYWDNGVVVSGVNVNENEMCGTKGCAQMSSSSSDVIVAYTALMNAIVAKGITPKHPVVRDTLAVDGMNVTILNPGENRLGSSPNSDSIAMKLENDGFCAILSGDIQETVESSITALGIPLKCQVLKVGSNGGGNSASFQFLDSIKPETAVISVGTTDPNLPSQTTLERLRLQNVQVYRTDINGTITMISSAGNYTVYTNK